MMGRELLLFVVQFALLRLDAAVDDANGQDHNDREEEQCAAFHRGSPFFARNL